MKLFANFLLILGFCIGTLGAAGFNQIDETTEANTYLYFGLGVAFIVAAGLFLRNANRVRPTDSGGKVHGLEWFHGAIESIRDQVVALDKEKAESSPADIHKRIDDLLAGDFFDLTSRHEELVSLVGFGNYAKVWDGVASTERLLARGWSMITDGHDEEGLAELPIARENIERAAQAIASLA